MRSRVAPAGFAALLLATSASALAADAPKRPNILVLLADDMGFSDPGCYGGEIATPNLDALAANGLRFTQFYNTARCWPTRTCLLTGYYPQQVRADPWDRKRGRPEWARLLPERLKPAGYRCYHSGKWHIVGTEKQVKQGGFDHSYSLDDHDRYFCPQKHTEDDVPLPPAAKDSGYYATTAIADHAVRCLREHAEKHPDRPFFSFVAFNAPHFPLHAPPEDIARYADRYKDGWDALRQERWQRIRGLGIVDGALAPREAGFTPRYFRPEVLAELGAGEVVHPVAWDSLDAGQKRFQAAKMAIHAAMVDRMDRGIGRVLEQLRAMGAYENTVVFFLSDNGADATVMVRGDRHDTRARPGSAETFLCLGPGWACASNTPFRRYKVWTHEAGISTPLIVHWPRGIAARGELRRDVGHVIDLAPTICELGGVQAAAAEGAPPWPGKSLVPAFSRDGAVSREFLYFHHEGNRAIRKGDWKLVSAREEDNAWQLFDLAHDRGETTDLAASEPEKVAELSRLWQKCEDEFLRQSGREGAAGEKTR